jgi:hypothetical protein
MDRANNAVEKQNHDEPSVFFKYPILQIIFGPTCIILLAHFLSPLPENDSTGIFSLRFPSSTACTIVALYLLLEVLLLRLVPGRRLAGPRSSAGDTPLYTLNGTVAWRRLNISFRFSLFGWLVGCLLVWLFGCLVVWLLVCLFACLFACLLVCLFVCFLVCLFVWLFGRLFVFVVVCLSVCCVPTTLC